MTPEEIKGALESRGWQAEIVTRDAVDDLVDVAADGLMKCVDGRPSDHPAMRGPKTLGGVYAIASVRGVTDVAGLAAIAEEVRAAGYVPSIHGDEHNGPLGCGYFKLWSNDSLEGLEPASFSGDAGKEAVVGAGGVYEMLAGDHEETHVVVNLVPDTTLEPKGDAQRFVVDAWITAKFKLDVPKYLTLAAETVEKLGGKKVAKIVIP